MKLSILVSLFLALPTVLFGSSAAMQLNQKLEHVDSFSASFSQQVLSEDGSPIQKSQGKVMIERPGQFRWETNKPVKQIIIANGKKLWIYEPDLEQVTVRKLVDNIGETPLVLLTSKNIVLQDDFQVQALAENKYELTPKSKKASFKQVVIQFSGKKPSIMTLKNKLGQTTKIHFSAIQLNPAFNKQVFNFTPPDHVDVVDLTKRSND